MGVAEVDHLRPPGRPLTADGGGGGGGGGGVGQQEWALFLAAHHGAALLQYDEGGLGGVGGL